MINVLEEVKKQDGIKIEYEDEKIASKTKILFREIRYQKQRKQERKNIENFRFCR